MTTVLTELDFTHDEPGQRRRRRIQSFHSTAREKIDELTSASRALEDLADSFPGLLYALATGYATPVRRRQALRLVVEGAPLREASEAVGLPWWTRRLCAPAFTEPLRPLPDTPEFNERISSFIPPNPEHARTWLWSVSYAAAACHPEFALWTGSWVARQRRTFDVAVGRDHFRYMAAWAWHAQQPTSHGFALLRRAWSPEIGLRRAIEELSVWRRRLRLAFCLGRGVDEPWLREGTALGYEFVALRTPTDFIRESEAMDNCLDQFADRLEDGRSRVFSIRRGARVAADIEIGTDALEAGMPTILQLRGPRNRLATPEIWRAAYTWLGAQDLRPWLRPAGESSTASLRRTARAYWRPYLDAVDPTIAAEVNEMLTSDLGFSIATRGSTRAERTSRPGKTGAMRSRSLAESSH